MKVALISGGFPPVRSGVGDYTFRLALALAEQPKVSVHVFTSAGIGIESTHAAWVNIHPVVRDWHLGCLSALRQMAHDVKPDVIHIQYPSWFNPQRTAIVHLLPLLLRKLPGNPAILFTLHEATRVRWRWLFRPLISGVLSDVIICVDEHDQRFIKRIFPWKQVECIHIGSNILPNESSFGYREQTRRALGLSPEDVLLFYFGGGRPTTGIGLLTQAYANLSRVMTQLKLMIVTDLESVSSDNYVLPEDARRLKEKIGQFGLWGNIILRTYAEPESLSKYLAAADIGVFPYTNGVSRQRGATLACLAHGLPVITTRSSRLPGDYHDQVNMYLIKPNDLEELQQAIRRLTESRDMRANLSVGARELSESFAWKRIAQQNIEAYESVLRKKNRC